MSLVMKGFIDERCADVNFKFEKNLLGVRKGVTITFLPNHSFFSNIQNENIKVIVNNRLGNTNLSFKESLIKNNSIFVRNGETLSFYKIDSCSKHLFYKCGVNIDGRFITTNEPTGLIDINSYGKEYYRVIGKHIKGHVEVEVI